MKENSELINYISQQRWCAFKQDIAENRVVDINLDSIPFDNGKKLFTLGEATLDDGSKKMFFMPMAKGHSNKYQTVMIDGEEMYDALKTPDYWEKLMEFFHDNHNHVTFHNGNVVKYRPIGPQEITENNIRSASKPLDVEQSNTTIRVGDNAIAFKQDRMIESDFGISTEVEMNHKLMEAECDAMPKTYGAFLMREPGGKTATLGIVQEFIPNEGDLWAYANNYLVEALKDAYQKGFNTVEPEEHKGFMALMENLGRKNENMFEALSRPNGNPDFEPEPVDEAYLRGYRKQLDVLLYQTKKTIEENIQNLEGAARTQTENLLQNWDNLTGKFVERNINLLANSEQKSTIVRVHGDFHLGQVLVTKDHDLKFLDFAGEPGLPIKERKKKHPETRDTAGMYRSLSGYLGPVVAETFAATGLTVKRANGSDKNVTDPRKEAWANRAIAPMIAAATKAFMQGRNEHQPMMALEILRKNLYEVGYEVGNRPDMAHIPVKGLVSLLSSEQSKVKEKIIGSYGNRAMNDNHSYVKRTADER